MLEYTRQSLEDLDLEDLNRNEGYLNIASNLNNSLYMYTLAEDCITCPFSRNREIESARQYSVKFDVSRPIQWQFYEEDHGQYAFPNVTPFCSIKPTNLGSRGVYNIDIDYENQCNFQVILNPININLSLLYALLVLVAILVVIYTGNYLYSLLKRFRQRSSGINSVKDLEKQSSTKPRLRSLDVFRGTAIIVMIFVNSGGGGYWFFEHATWNGLYVADLVFPWFLWIMGVCIPISIKSQLARNSSILQIIRTIMIRSIKLFLIGLFLNSRGRRRIEEIRIMGVLQRFGIAYFVVAFIHVILYVKPKSSSDVVGKFKRLVYDIWILTYQWVTILFLICIYLILIFALRVPGCPSGYLGPGGKHEMTEHMNCIGGATGYIDRIILGAKHIYQYPTARSVYDSQPFDPEGLVGCLPTILQVFIGLQCGITLMVYADWKARTKRLIIWAIVLGILSGILCNFSQDGGVIPINKNLWSLSFVFATSALAYILLTFFYIVVDVGKWWSGTPLLYAGMNSILLFVGHGVIGSRLPWRWTVGPMNTHFVLMIQNMWHAGMWVVVAYYFYCKKVFISV